MKSTSARSFRWSDLLRASVVGILLVVSLAAAGLATASAGATTLVSRAPGGGPALRPAYVGVEAPCTMSADGRYVVFVSDALNFSSGTNGKDQVYVRDRVTATTQLVSLSSGGTMADGYCWRAVISGNGRYVAFQSDAANLVNGDVNGVPDVFVRDLQTNTTVLASTGSNGVQANNDPEPDMAISFDGRFVAFSSFASTFRPAGSPQVPEVYVKDMSLGTLDMVSVANDGSPGNNSPWWEIRTNGVSISADGRYVAFQSTATNLVPGDTNAARDIFVRDRLQRTTERVSVSSAGAQGNGSSHAPFITPDGRYITFFSSATNLVQPGTSGTQSFLHDRSNGTTELISVGLAGALPDDSSFGSSATPDGRYVAFCSLARNLTQSGSGVRIDTYLRDRLNGSTERVSLGSAGEPPNGESNIYAPQPAVSADGSAVLFGCNATNLVVGGSAPGFNYFVRNRSAGATELISVGTGGVRGVGGARSGDASVSADGRFVAFTSDADNLVPGDTNELSDVFVWDRVLGSTEMVSVSTAGALGNGPSSSPSVSADGRYVAFYSGSDNLTQGFPGGIFVRDRLRGTTEAANPNTQVYGQYSPPAISADGRFVAFASSGKGLVETDNGGLTDVYVRDRVLGTTERVSLGANGELGNDSASYARPAISADGRYVAFITAASNLVFNDQNPRPDVFVRDRKNATTERVSVRTDGANFLGKAEQVAMSADGRYVAFVSSQLQYGATEAFVRDRVAGTTETVSVTLQGAPSQAQVFQVDISGDGRFVTFTSTAEDLVPGDTNKMDDVFVRDRLLGVTERADVASGGSQSDRQYPYADAISISADGRFVAFASGADNLVGDDINGTVDVFLRDRGGSGQPPAAPANLTATAQAGRQIRLDWTDASSNEALFRIERSEDGGTTFSAVGIAVINSTSFLDSGLTPGATYTYRVSACNADGASASNLASARVPGSPPGAPANLTAVAATDSTAQLGWTPGPGTNQTIQVERAPAGGSFALVATTPEGATSYLDTGLSSNSSYNYRIKAVNPDGASDYSSTVEVLTLPSAPLDLTAVTVSRSRINLHWTDGSSIAANTEVQRSLDGKSFASVANVPAGLTSYSDMSLAAGTLYYYRVRAFNGSGSSAFAQAQATTIPDPPGIPSGLKADAVGDQQIDLSWHPGLPAGDTFYLERRSGDGSFGQIAQVAGTSYSDTGLTPATQYEYRLRAGNVSGFSDYGQSLTVTTTVTARGQLVVPRKSNFGNTRVGSYRDLTVTVHNASSSEYLRITLGKPTGDFALTVSSGSRIIAPGGNFLLAMRFTPHKKTKSTGELILTSSDPQAATVKLQLVGVGIKR